MKKQEIAKEKQYDAMGMVLGLLPIVGAPLPIMSYGGSSMLAIMFGLGVAMSCKVYKDTPVN